MSESGEVVGGRGGGEVGAGEVCVCGGREVRGAGEGEWSCCCCCWVGGLDVDILALALLRGSDLLF